MTTIKIISATPGPTTSERILELIKSQGTGVTIKELSSQINRPVSMLQICLAQLVSSKQIRIKSCDAGNTVNPIEAAIASSYAETSSKFYEVRGSPALKRRGLSDRRASYKTVYLEYIYNEVNSELATGDRRI
ncbi:MAG TPA: hypothetical protein ACFCUY_12120 [Xenococcaceae cyanobacterium]